MTRIAAVEQAAKEGNMTAREWRKDDSETRMYLSRTNAARTEAGYIALLKSPEGKMSVKLVITATGTGSRTAESEAESVLSKYKAIRAAVAK